MGNLESDDGAASIECTGADRCPVAGEYGLCYVEGNGMSCPNGPYVRRVGVLGTQHVATRKGSGTGGYSKRKQMETTRGTGFAR